MAGLVSKLRLLLSSSYARDGVKASHACQNHGKLLPIYDLEKITAAPLSRPYLTGL
jgi:hypothetical protein